MVRWNSKSMGAKQRSGITRVALKHQPEFDNLYINVMVFGVVTGFHIRFENRLPCRATNIELRLPDKTFWLPDNINVKTCSKTFGQGVNFWLPDRKKWLPRATGYVKPCVRITYLYIAPLNYRKFLFLIYIYLFCFSRLNFSMNETNC